MAEQDDGQKTEDPSQRRLQRAREEGQIAQSREINTW
ncbi:MAG: EscU/YscU/HrcU family type III secretion system export apparatus switch protein, partial [Stellaceae bacterium]